MPIETKSRAELIRWTLGMGAAEFAISPRTISARMRQSGLTPGQDGRYSTKQIHAAVCGNLEAELNVERLHKLQVESQRIDLQNARTRGELIQVEAVYRHFEHFFIALRARILGSGLTDDEKDELLKDLRGITVRNLPTNGS